MDGDRAAAWAVAALASRQNVAAQQALVMRALVLAVTHSNDEVRNYAALGVGENLWTTDRGLAARCVNLLALEVLQVEEEMRKQDHLPHQKCRDTYDVEAEVATTVRTQFFKTGGIPFDACQKCDPATWLGAEAFSRMLSILLHAPSEPMAINAFRRTAVTLVAWWNADNDRRNRRERPLELEPTLTDLLQRFAFRVPSETARDLLEPLMAAVDDHPSNVSRIVKGLIEVEDRERQPAKFWFLWELFADKVTSARWLQHIDEDHPYGSEVVSAIFLKIMWKESVRHWPSLGGYADRVHSLFERLPPSARIYENYVRFLYDIGEQSVPETFLRLAGKLAAADPAWLLRGRNTIFLLESLLQRHVYARPLELKPRAEMKNAILLILDLLVENGSSAAFRMRDDFVTPVSVA